MVTFKTTLLEETGFRFAVDRLRTIPAGQQPPKEMFAGALEVDGASETKRLDPCRRCNSLAALTETPRCRFLAHPNVCVLQA